ncbi:hypothetical protein SAMN05421819_1781 [Bryocella elongata]|uniref:Uncharacterized protein n=2 Tax=Bryocella elongata TaxID=863522 RepID=A0A1H5WWZ2_9BACT|nr:hypothetical protein SAMN05421819_1781 [Bryocella elongata]
MSAMSLAFGPGFGPATRETELTQSHRGAAVAALPSVQQETKVKRRIEDLALNELLYHALYGDLSQFSIDV